MTILDLQKINSIFVPESYISLPYPIATNHFFGYVFGYVEMKNAPEDA